MAINPMKLLKLKDRYSCFKKDHPKLMSFMSVASKEHFEVGSTVKIAITNNAGKTIGTEFELTPDDIKTIELLKELKKSQAGCLWI